MLPWVWDYQLEPVGLTIWYTIEGNDYPSSRIYQMPVVHKGLQGLMNSSLMCD